jgi:hypothetical protein
MEVIGSRVKGFIRIPSIVDLLAPPALSLFGEFASMQEIIRILDRRKRSVSCHEGFTWFFM